MPSGGVLAFLTLGPVEAVVIAIVAVLLFGPAAARAMGKLGRTVLGVKKEIDDVKSSLQREVTKAVHDALSADQPSARKPEPPEHTE